MSDIDFLIDCFTDNYWKLLFLLIIVALFIIMASLAQSKLIKYIYDLPYLERKKLCDILNQHDRWEDLAGEAKLLTVYFDNLYSIRILNKYNFICHRHLDEI